MSLLTSNDDVSGVLPPEFAQLITAPLEAQALAFQPEIASIIRTTANSVYVPILAEDVAAAWVPEGNEITPDDPVVDTLVITPTKVAGLTIVSNEMAADSHGDAQKLVGQSLARSVRRQVDKAYVSSVAAPAPKGLADLTGFTTVDSGGSIANLDLFAQAVGAGEEVGANISAWIMSPSDALTIAQLKTGTGSNQSLLENPRLILGRKVFVSEFVTAGTIYGVDKTRNLTVARADVVLARSDSYAFSKDSLALRATMRIGFGFPVPTSVVKIYDAV